MGFKGNRILVIAIIIAIIVIVTIGLASSGSSRAPAGTYLGKVYSVTVIGDIGVASIQITNLNSPSTKPWTVLPINLPYTFNCTSGDTLTFNATAKESFIFNYWCPNSGMPYSSNPYTVKVQQPLMVTVQFKPEEMP